MFEYNDFLDANINENLILPIARILDPWKILVDNNVFPISNVASFRDLLTFRPNTWIRDYCVFLFAQYIQKSSNFNSSFYCIDPVTFAKIIKSRQQIEKFLRKANIWPLRKCSFKKLLFIFYTTNHYVVVEILLDNLKKTCPPKEKKQVVVSVADPLDYPFSDVLEELDAKHLDVFIRVLDSTELTITFEKASNNLVQRNLSDCGIVCMVRVYLYFKFGTVKLSEHQSAEFTNYNLMRLVLLQQILLFYRDNVSIYVALLEEENTSTSSSNLDALVVAAAQMETSESNNLEVSQTYKTQSVSNTQDADSTMETNEAKKCDAPAKETENPNASENAIHQQVDITSNLERPIHPTNLNDQFYVYSMIQSHQQQGIAQNMQASVPQSNSDDLANTDTQQQSNLSVRKTPSRKAVIVSYQNEKKDDDSVNNSDETGTQQSANEDDSRSAIEEENLEVVIEELPVDQEASAVGEVPLSPPLHTFRIPAVYVAGHGFLTVEDQADKEMNRMLDRDIGINDSDTSTQSETSSVSKKKAIAKRLYDQQARKAREMQSEETKDENSSNNDSEKAASEDLVDSDDKEQAIQARRTEAKKNARRQSKKTKQPSKNSSKLPKKKTTFVIPAVRNTSTTPTNETRPTNSRLLEPTNPDGISPNVAVRHGGRKRITTNSNVYVPAKRPKDQTALIEKKRRAPGYDERNRASKLAATNQEITRFDLWHDVDSSQMVEADLFNENPFYFVDKKLPNKDHNFRRDENRFKRILYDPSQLSSDIAKKATKAELTN